MKEPIAVDDKRIFGIVDDLVTEESGRIQAAKQLGDIARQYPDLVQRFAERLRDDTGVGNRSSPARHKYAGMPTTQAVLKWLKDNEEGRAGELVEALADQIVTTSDKPANVIYSTLASLEGRKKIESYEGEDGEKVYALPEGG